MGEDGDNKNWGYMSTHTHQAAPVTELGSQKEKSFARDNEGAQFPEMP